MSPSPALTAPYLLRVIRAHHLVDADRLDLVLKSVPQEAIDAENPKRLAEALVSARLLTKLQATLLVQGKSRSLTIAGKYRLIDRLGAGGMGLVYLCEHLKMRRLVAVKVLANRHPPGSGQLDSLLREAQAAATMKHPNIVQAYDLDQDNGIHYLVMEFVDGADLERLVRKNGPLDPRRAAHYVAQAAAGLQHAADRGLVHRDIKPSNLLVDRDGLVKVLDLGLVRLAGSSRHAERFDANAIVGTADYISPEQAHNSQDVDSRSDIYSLGCTFYFLLAGRAPFQNEAVTQKLVMHQVMPPTPIREVRADVPAGMAEVLARMMAKNPADRYQSPADVVAALAEWTDPPPPPPAETELPRPAFGGASPSDSSVSGRGQVTLTLSATRLRSGSSGILASHSPRELPEAKLAPLQSQLGRLVPVVAVVISLVALLVLVWRAWGGPPPEVAPCNTTPITGR